MTARTPREQTTGIVLVGTHPWTNSAFDRLLPRTLLPVAHRPLLSYALSWLRAGDISDVAVCANRETQTLQSRLLRHVPPGMTVTYHEDLMPRGAAGAVRDAAAASDAETFVITDGTSIPTVDLRDLLATHHASGAALTLVVHSESGRHGNPCSRVPSGIYVCNREALKDMPPSGFYDIKENLIPQLHRSGKRVLAYSAESASPRVLDAASYLAVNEWIVEQLATTDEAPEGYVRSGNCLIHQAATIADDVVFVGPVLVGPGARIMSGAVLVGPTSIGREATVGRRVLVSRSAIWRRCSLGEHAVADRCILADDTIVEPHTHAFRAVIFAHFRHQDPETIREAALEAREHGSLEWFRKMGRLVTGAAWSRSPAPQ